MSSEPLEPGLYHIKSQQSDDYLTALFPGNGRIVAQPEKGEPFAINPEGPNFVIYFRGIPVGVVGDHLIAQPNVPQVVWKVTKAEAQGAWVFERDDEPRGWWFDPEQEDNLTIRPLIAIPSYPPQYPPPELFVLEMA
ncbi:hypothetical protein BDV27DRAFT_134070 [Aspergillus caelatus]|uniref:Uncharacterized protein n=1 Tax=Aspergillus caelatus TaxID=61420 RepID=A0A5N6ZWQ4_9EURO|nr:uncharacterized protein BDV27DRAFT_134070 [Aspergillus caelatus]KAE8360690.1 hypothetical protein BDV27DRAFT_134070 [Aspergillus caelatus]